MKSLSEFVIESIFSSFGSIDRGDIIYVGVGTNKDFNIHQITVKSANLRSSKDGHKYMNLTFDQPISEKIDKTKIKITSTKSIDVVETDSDGTVTILGTTENDVKNYFKNLK